MICSIYCRDLRSPAVALATAHDGRSDMAEKVPILVVVAIDIDDKPHASRFAEHDAPFVQRAAELMGFHVVRVPPDKAELHGIAKGLPLGKIFATGRAFVPFVRRSAFDKLATLVKGGVTIEARAAAGVDPVYRLADMFTTEDRNTHSIFQSVLPATGAEGRRALTACGALVMSRPTQEVSCSHYASASTALSISAPSSVWSASTPRRPCRSPSMSITGHSPHSRKRGAKAAWRSPLNMKPTS